MVVAIISVLVALLLPALSTSREHARTVVCSTNLRQIHVAWTMYLDDYHGKLPLNWDTARPWAERDWYGWYIYLTPYFKKPHSEVWYCPTHNIKLGSTSQVFPINWRQSRQR